MVANKEMERVAMVRPKKRKRVSVSSKRQVCIPKEFYETLNLGDDIYMELYDNRIVIKPVEENYSDFSSEILRDLIEEGYEGEELLKEFNLRKNQIRPAVKAMIDEAIENSESVDMEDLFGDVENED